MRPQYNPQPGMTRGTAETPKHYRMPTNYLLIFHENERSRHQTIIKSTFVCFHACLTFQTWRWGRHVSSKRRLIFIGLQGIISHKTELFLVAESVMWLATAQKLGLRFLGKAWRFPFCVQPGSTSHVASFTMDTGRFSVRDKTAGAWTWVVIYIEYRGWDCVQI
jgi:hypothetical protein